MNFSQVKCVIADPDGLVSRIADDHKIQKKVEEPLSLNIFRSSIDASKSTTGLNGQFVFSQLLIDCLLRLKSNPIDKTELIDLLKSEYEGNPNELKNVLEFEEGYLPDKVLWLYTKESFFYKTLNAALRTQNIHTLFLYREFIADMHRQLQHDQVNHPLQVYRSQLISGDELENLKKNIGQFISINSFFSTSTDRATALFYLGDLNSPIDLTLVRVMFEIDADPQMVTTKPFADISEFSHFRDELEVLFMIGTIFRLNTIHCTDDHVWIIRMSLCRDDEYALKQVFLRMKQQSGTGQTSLQTLGKIVWEMGKLDLAEQYIQRSINNLPTNSFLLCNLYEDLGKIASQKGDYDTSIEWYQKALELPKPIVSAGESLEQCERSEDRVGARYTLTNFALKPVHFRRDRCH